MLRSGKNYKRLAKAALVWVFLLAWFAPTPVAATTYTVVAESDWYFDIGADSTAVIIYGNSNASCDDMIFTDPYLWLYDSNDTLLVENDDGNHNENDQCVSAKIAITLDSGSYRLRAGYYPEATQSGEYELVTGLSLGTTYTPPTSTTTTTTTTTTPVPQTIGDPTNLTLSVNYYNGSVKVDWGAPTDGNVDPERYAIGFGLNDEGNAGPYGIATGNVGGEMSLVTEYTFNSSYIALLFNEAHGLFNVKIRSDNDTNSMYSGWTDVASTSIMNMPDVVDNQVYQRDEATGDLTFSWDASSDGFVAPSHYKIAWNQLGGVGEVDESNVTYTQNISSTSHTVAYDDLGNGTWYFNILACGSENDCHIGETMEIQVEEGVPPTTTTTTTVPPTTTTTTTTTVPPTTTTTTVPPTTTTTTTTTVPPTTTTTTVPPTTTTTTTSTIPVTPTTSLPPTTTEAPQSTTTTTVPTTTTTVTPTMPTSAPTTTTTVRPTTTTTVRPTTTTTPTTLPPEPEPEPEPEIVIVNGAEIEFEFVDEATGESLSVDEFFEEFNVKEEDQEIALAFNVLGVDIDDVELSEIDAAEEKVVAYLASIDEQLAEDFLNVVDGEVTVEEISALVLDANFADTTDDIKQILVEALNDADAEVKEEFEDAVNIFEDDAYNEYVADGSSVDTETRRTIVAATAAATVAMSATGGKSGGGGSGGGSGGGGSGGGGSGGSDSSGDKKSSRRRKSR
jgi:uncharacterized membrane protein YgcG